MKQKQCIKSRKLSKKRGSELAETILIIAISMVLIVTLFYPQISNLVSGSLSSMNNWFTAAMSQIGI